MPGARHDGQVALVMLKLESQLSLKLCLYSFLGKNQVSWSNLSSNLRQAHFVGSAHQYQDPSPVLDSRHSLTAYTPPT